MMSQLASSVSKLFTRSPSVGEEPKTGVVLVRETDVWTQKRMEFDPTEGVIRLTGGGKEFTARVTDRNLFKVKPSPYRIPQYPEALALHLYPLAFDQHASEMNDELHISSIDRKDILEWSYFFQRWIQDKPATPSIVLDLSPAEEVVASNLLRRSGNQTAVLVDKFNIQVTRKTLSCLEPGEWLSDELVNFYFSLLYADTPKVFCWSSFFYTKLTAGGSGYNYRGVRSWTTKKGVDLFDASKVTTVLIPLHIVDQAHWALGVVDMLSATTIYLDSLGGESDEFHDTIHRYLEDEYRDKKGDSGRDPIVFTRKSPPNDLPMQANGSDCGVFICMYALAIVRGLQPTAEPLEDRVEVMRRRMAVDIVNGAIGK